LREWQPPALSGAARARIVAQLVAARPLHAAPRRAAPRPSLLLGALAAAAALLLVWRGARMPETTPTPAAVPSVAAAARPHWAPCTRPPSGRRPRERPGRAGRRRHHRRAPWRRRPPRAPRRRRSGRRR